MSEFGVAKSKEQILLSAEKAKKDLFESERASRRHQYCILSVFSLLFVMAHFFYEIVGDNSGLLVIVALFSMFFQCVQILDQDEVRDADSDGWFRIIRRAFIFAGCFGAFFLSAEYSGELLATVCALSIAIMAWASIVMVSRRESFRNCIAESKEASEKLCAKLLPAMVDKDIASYRDEVVAHNRRFTVGEARILLKHWETVQATMATPEEKEACASVYMGGLKA